MLSKLFVNRYWYKKSKIVCLLVYEDSQTCSFFSAWWKNYCNWCKYTSYYFHPLLITGVPIVTVSATDADARAPFNSITYQIVNSSEPGFFTINSDGQVSLLKSISNRQPNSYTLKIVARDQAPTPRSSQEATVIINVLKNRFAPVARIEPNPINIGE